MDVRDLERGRPVDVAVRLLGGIVTAGEVVVRIDEVEAYGGPADGPWPDPASHSFRGPTARNEVMFGPAGHLYVYLSYGMHVCINVTCGPVGTAAAVLLRAGEVTAGHELVDSRRGSAGRSARGGASGPGNLGKALGVGLVDNGTDMFDDSAPVTLQLRGRPLKGSAVGCGPRVGVSLAADRPWRFWTQGSPAVSAYRRSPRASVADEPER
ncbi:DNA-3-methyladenine glycosylase [Rhodococcus sp. AW25M09]|uniref:DNA-3-methyladenine glycosylase n=1 Tax=Rhodococcus sp. AW25M09 TaxID=1268303 RepID=UPI0005B4EA2F|nr:DNA-3-methyladenine glycosylase [Rhodococcus sp. AW25M09]